MKEVGWMIVDAGRGALAFAISFYAVALAFEYLGPKDHGRGAVSLVGGLFLLVVISALWLWYKK
jgi:vacuolar-type H+-ATPase subunit I/STV1